MDELTMRLRLIDLGVGEGQQQKRTQQLLVLLDTKTQPITSLASQPHPKLLGPYPNFVVALRRGEGWF